MSEKEKKQKQQKKNTVVFDKLGEVFKGFDKKLKDYDYKQLLTFEKMYALSAIKLIYWVGGILICFQSIYFLLTADSVGSFLLELVKWPLSLILLRIVCELWMVFFGIFERLGEIKKELSKK